MSLRQNALLLVLLAVLIAIAGDWSSDLELARWWRAPLGLLLVGLAYEAAMSHRAGLQLQVRAAARWLLCRASPLQFEVRTQTQRSAALELALEPWRASSCPPRAPA
jgi:hypothetical protein